MKWVVSCLICALLLFLSFLFIDDIKLYLLIQKVIPNNYINSNIYLLSDVDLCCRPLLRDQQSNNKINIFFFNDSFSDIDIKNFKIFFKISPSDRIEILDDKWLLLFNKLNHKYNRNSLISANFSFGFSKKGMINNLKVF